MDDYSQQINYKNGLNKHMENLIKTITISIFIIALLISCKHLDEKKGIISVAGNVPFSYLRIITEDKKEYKIVGEKKEELFKFQGEILIIKGKIIKENKTVGRPGEFFVKEYKK